MASGTAQRRPYLQRTNVSYTLLRLQLLPLPSSGSDVLLALTGLSVKEPWNSELEAKDNTDQVSKIPDIL